MKNMRELLFRGKGTVDGNWIIGDGIHRPKSINYKGRVFIGGIEEKADEWFEVDPGTIGQYTGLNDKNGSRIFEGDILVGYNTYNFKVCIEDGHAVIKWEDSGEKLTENLESEYIKENDVVIIGNHWDNPELLEDRQ